MPMIDVKGGRINVEVEGRDDAPALMLSNSLGTNLHMWDEQAAEFRKHFRLVRYDRRGHGKSDVTPGPYSMEMLGHDVLAILDALKIAKTNWCGLSMGGMVGTWLGANAPERVNKLVLANFTDYYPDKTPWNDRIKTIRAGGLASIVEGNMGRWFTEPFRKAHPEVTKRFTDEFLKTKLDGYIACGEAVRDMDHRALIPKIKAPTMIIAGRHDGATTLAMAESMRDRLPGAKLTVLEAAHISNAEQPAQFTKTVLDFLRS